MHALNTCGSLCLYACNHDAHAGSRRRNTVGALRKQGREVRPSRVYKDLDLRRVQIAMLLCTYEHFHTEESITYSDGYRDGPNEFTYRKYILRKTKRGFGFIIEAVPGFEGSYKDVQRIKRGVCDAIQQSETTRWSSPFGEKAAQDVIRWMSPKPTVVHTGDQVSTERFLQTARTKESRFRRAARGVLLHYLRRFSADPRTYVTKHITTQPHKNKKGRWVDHFDGDPIDQYPERYKVPFECGCATT